MEISEQTPVVAFFQPIIAADSGAIYAYEALGRYIDDAGNVRSLGPFFENPATSPDVALKIDRRVRRDAMVKFSRTAMDAFLFINVRLQWLLPYADYPEKLPTMHWARELNIPADRLVIEITEHEFTENNAAYMRVIQYYRSQGCRIAIDDYGKDASNLDRLAKILPHIIKINMEYVQRSETSYFYEEYLRALAVFAERIGSEILFEGVETDKQLRLCLDACGRYYQGYLLAKPQPDLAVATADLMRFKQLEIEVLRNIIEQSVWINGLVKGWEAWQTEFCRQHYPENDNFAALEIFLRQLCAAAPKEIRRRIIRAYVCSPAGEQLSPNIEPHDTAPITPPSYPRNWGWRPYFRAARRFFAFGSQAFISEHYRDIHLRSKIHTLVYAIPARTYVLIDISETPI